MGKGLALLACGLALGLSACGITDAATSVSDTGATLNGRVHSRGGPMTWWFQYGETTAYGSQTTHEDAGTASQLVPVSKAVTGLTPATSYHFRLCTLKSGEPTSCAQDAMFTTRPGVPGLTVSVGYANDEADDATPFPADWGTSSGTTGSVTFLGDRKYVAPFDIYIWDSGGVRFDNTTGSAIKLDKVTVTIGSRTYNADGGLWPSAQLVVPASGTLILASAGGKDFDTSDALGLRVGCDGGSPPPPAEIAVVHAGVTTTFRDTERPRTPAWPSGVLTYDCGPETHPWHRVEASG